MEYEPNAWAAFDEIPGFADLSSFPPTSTDWPEVPGGSSLPAGSGSGLPTDIPSWTTTAPTEDDWYPTTAGPDTPKDPNIFSSYATQATSNAAAIGAIAGIVVAIVAVIVIFILLCCFREKIMAKVCPEKSLVSDESGLEDDEEFEVAYSDVHSYGASSRGSATTRRNVTTGFGGGNRSLVMSDGSSAIDTVSVDRFRAEYNDSVSNASAEY